MYVGTWDFLALNHYTTFFVSENKERFPLFMDSDVGVIQDETYPIAASVWLQVNKEENGLSDIY